MADSRNLLSQLASKTAALPPRVEQGSDDEGVVVDRHGPVGCLRGVRERAIMLELRRKDGAITAFGYAWLERIDFDPSTGIVLGFAGSKVTIRGRNLNAEIRPQVRLLDGLVRHRIAWIQEADEPGLLRADRHATVIERIEVE
jgi:hypothetical protein